MNEEGVQFNYYFQLVVCWLIITGGLGYLVIINQYELVRRRITKFSLQRIHITLSIVPWVSIESAPILISF